MAFNLDQILSTVYWGNTVEQYAYAIGLFLIIIFGVMIVKAIVIARLKVLAKKTKNELDDVLLDTIDEIKWPFYVLIALFSAIRYISISDTLNSVFFFLTIFVAIFYVAKIIRVLIVQGSKAFTEKDRAPDEEFDDSMPNIIATIIQIILWIGALLFVLSNFGFDVGTALAGIGIGGIAIAFALQNVLSDIFASFSIYFDKPFKKGDFIVIGTDSGTVQKIGIKSTRIKTLQGQELVVSNKELTESRINNYKKMEKRRVTFKLGVTYDTTQANLKVIPKIVGKIIIDIPEVDFDRCHFKSFGDFSLDFECVYYVNMSDYSKYMDVQQDINLKINKEFAKKKIDFAYPTQSLLVKNLKSK